MRAVSHRSLDLFAFDAAPFAVEEDAGLAGARVKRHAFARQAGGEALGDPEGRIVILAEDDAAVFEPVFRSQKMKDGVELGVCRAAAERFDNALQVEAFRIENLEQFR